MLRFLFVCAMVLSVTGCQLTPSRANITDYSRCTFNITFSGTNGVPVGDMFAQNMIVENSGSEALTAEQETKPDTSVQLSKKSSPASPISSIKEIVKDIAGGGDCEDCEDCSD